MRKIFLGLALLLINILILKAEEERISIYSEIADSENETLNSTEERVYCYSPDSGPYFAYDDTTELNRCNPSPQYKTKNIEIPESLYLKLKAVDTLYQDQMVQERRSLFFPPSETKIKQLQNERDKEFSNILNSSSQEILKFNENRKVAVKEKIEKIKKETDRKKIAEAEKQKKLYVELEKSYGRSCSKFSKDRNQFNSCLIEQNKIAKEKEQKRLLEIVEKENIKKKEIEDKQKLAAARSKDEELKLSKMNPDDRRSYTCSEKFGFRKGSDKFKDCVFKIYAAEIEMEKLELQKQLAKANADLARANADRQDRLALAQAETAKMQSLAAQQQAIAANTARNLALMETGLRMMQPPPQPQFMAPRTCTFTGNFMNCF